MQVLRRGDISQRARLCSGLVLFAFVLTHFLNHAAGLISLETMLEVERARQVITRSTAGSLILGAALLIHIVLALQKVATRTTWKMQPWELAQLVLGLLIPLLLFPHIVNTRVASAVFGVTDNYLYELVRLWPVSAAVQSLLLVFVWTHACIGLHFWLRLSPTYRLLQPIAFAAAIIVPVAALAGFMVSGRAVSELTKNAELMDRIKAATHWPTEAIFDRLGVFRAWSRLAFAGLLALVGAIIAIARARSLSHPKITVRYNGGPTVRAPRGASLLEISRMNDIPHASVCGGRARCSTCRVRIEDSETPLPPPAPHEAAALASIKAPPNVRLACQIRPLGSITATRLLQPSSVGPESIALPVQAGGGNQLELAVMHVSLRDFASIVLEKLPNDSAFIFNSFLSATTDAVQAQGGRIERISEDGFAATFGIDDGAMTGCQEALRAARAVDLAMDHVNAILNNESSEALQVSIGIHVASMLVAEIGDGSDTDLMALGPGFSVAYWLAHAAGERNAQVVISQEAAVRAGWTPSAAVNKPIDDPSTGARYEAFGLARGRDLPVSILTTA